MINGRCPNCGSKLELIKDVGWDIDEDGEQRQHLQQCHECKTSRLIQEINFIDGRPLEVFYNKMK